MIFVDDKGRAIGPRLVREQAPDRAEKLLVILALASAAWALLLGVFVLLSRCA